MLAARGTIQAGGTGARADQMAGVAAALASRLGGEAGLWRWRLEVRGDGQSELDSCRQQDLLSGDDSSQLQGDLYCRN